MVYILIPTRNRKDLLAACLNSIFNQTYKDFEVIIINDGSNDGTEEMIKRQFSKVTMLKGDGNLWWTGAMRLGVEKILHMVSSEDYVLIQNDDTYMNKRYLEKLLNIAQDGENLIVGTSVKDIKTNNLIYNSHQIIKGSLRPVVLDSESDLNKTYTLSGRGVLIPISVFQKIGNFSILFPQYAADYDFFCRARKTGYELVVTNQISTFSTNVKPNLASRLKVKGRSSIKDFLELFFSRRSSNNFWSSILITLIHVPFPINLYGIFRIFAFALKFLLVNVVWFNVKSIFIK